MSDHATPQPADSAPALSQIERVVDTFIAPGKTFTDIRRSASWWLPWLLISILGIGYAFALQQNIGWGQVYENMLHQNPKAMARLQQMPPDRVATAESIGSKSTEISAYADPVLLLLVGLIGAGVLWGTVNWVFGGRAKYSEIFALWFYASLPMALVTILAVISLYAGLDPSTFNLKNPVGTNIGYYLSGSAPQWIVTMLTSVDVLKIWTAVLLTIGCAKIANIKKSSAAIAVFGWWIVIILISVATVAAMG